MDGKELDFLGDLEYPRPLLRRESFFCLNGIWDLNGQEIHVPFPPQAPLSGFRGSVPDQMTYRRRFSLPEGFLRPGYRALLHFGAVDQTAQVILNGKNVARHEGGYLPFSADVTDALDPGENTLSVTVTDTLDPKYPRGKQSKKPGGMWYTPVSGIWQTVWLEAVPRAYIRGLHFETDMGHAYVTPSLSGAESAQITVGGVTLPCPDGKRTCFTLPSPRLWSPGDPYLYPVFARTGEDEVRSYCALRTIDKRLCGDGREHICLNGRPLFLTGVLDQGYYPDGLFIPGDCRTVIEDLGRMKRMGMNTIRKHIKIEPQVFYTCCDRLGLLVWQDMVSSGPYNFVRDTLLPNLGVKRRPDPRKGDGMRRRFFEKHCLDTLDHFGSHPCIAGYSIFNEGWGQYDSGRIYRMLKEHVENTLFITASGWFKGYPTDVDSEHIYFRNKVLRAGSNPMILSECGGFTLDNGAEGKKSYGYGRAADQNGLTERILLLLRRMVLPSIRHGLNGVIYTQLSDVEEETNGLLTYDRKHVKVDEARIREGLEECRGAFLRLFE